MSRAISSAALAAVLTFSSVAAAEETAPAATQQPAQPTSQILPSKGKAFNPDISANFLGLLSRGTNRSSARTAVPRNGFTLQATEFMFSADVDPYFRAITLLSVRQEGGTSGNIIEPEEAYLETLSLSRIGIRAGKFKLAFGKHNTLHTHAFPFIDAPLIHEAVFGDEGLNEVGVSAAYLLPTSWYSELIVQAFDPANGTLFSSPSAGDLGGLARFKNLWDLTDDLTAELGLSGTMAKNASNLTASALGADLTFKWRPSVGGKYQALVWSTEYLNAWRPGLTDPASLLPTERLGGLATWMQYQFAQRWWAEARVEFVGLPHDAAISVQNKHSALLGFFPSEFSGLRLQYDHLVTPGAAKADHTVALQYNVSIGAHPAHTY